MNVYDTANQLERELRMLPEYIALKESREKIKDDPKAVELFEEFKKIQKELDSKVMTGEIPSEEEQAKLSEIAKKVGENVILSEMLSKEHVFGQIIQDVTGLIQAPLSELYR
ncbi:MAG: YlbF family regulator [Lactobacillales bacterium]|jgi:cell fate (sporulation/competence/biofilm development) regulator YlbF (YheA/YmcA/DUF963 family)|nr:YlbF family regulator [Lactobacillales bacterium]